MRSRDQIFSTIMQNYNKYQVLCHHDNISAYSILLPVHCPCYLTAEISAVFLRVNSVTALQVFPYSDEEQNNLLAVVQRPCM